MNGFEIPGRGWQQDVADFRDYGLGSSRVIEMLAPLAGEVDGGDSRKTDLREYFADVCHQGSINSATAHVCIGLLEYYYRRCMGRYVKLSRLFLYKTSRKLMSVSGNVSTDLRSTFKAMRSCGVPPEHYWPYAEGQFDREPDSFLYTFAEPYKSVVYVRLDTPTARGRPTLNIVKSFLAAGFPVAFGFPVPSSISRAADIPYRPRFDGVCGGHSVLAVGYDDERIRESKGALLIRNSWGANWGDSGYGWLPYAYVNRLLASDFWTILKPEWIEAGNFLRPRVSVAALDSEL